MNELNNNTELIKKGVDENSSSGSDDCPSEDNLSKAVLRHILPAEGKDKSGSNAKLKEDLRSIFGWAKKKKPAPETKKEKKEEKKLPPPPPAKVEKKIPPKKPPPPPVKEEIKEKQGGTGEPAITYVDAATQTEKIDFQKARAKWVMSKFGKSQAQARKSANTMSPPHVKGKDRTSDIPKAPVTKTGTANSMKKDTGGKSSGVISKNPMPAKK